MIYSYKGEFLMQKYLEFSNIIDYHHPLVTAKAQELASRCSSDTEIAKKCFEFARDKIRHSGDFKDDITTYRASDVLKHKTGWCYAKSHLLAALLRTNGIPAGFTYQRLSCSEYEEGVYCLHGLNWIHLKEYGWYRVDARGNKEGVDAQFTPPTEKLAFEVGENEYDLLDNLAEPLDVVVDTLKNCKSYSQMVANFPDIEK